MEDKFTFDGDHDAYTMTIEEAGVHHRITVPKAFLKEELGDFAGEEKERDYLRQNLPYILQACTAKQSGGTVSAPWGRLLIEEID